MTSERDRAARIAALNDAFRATFAGGRVYLTDGVDALSDEVKREVIARVQTFAAFDAGNDPHGEHDFGALEVGGERVFFKIDYFDARDPDLGAEDPANAVTTARVLTIMRADEY